jgi:glyoxylase-like metal-dependent hydrolase (beta-lactamase superfamily II)
VEAAGWQVALMEVGMVPIQGSLLGPAGSVSGVLESPVNVLVLRGDGRTVLVDTGSGPLAGLWEGATDRLVEALAAEAIEPDLVVVTHLDFDHAGGLVAGEWSGTLAAAFPGCPVFAPADAIADARARRDEERPASRIVATLDAAGTLAGYADGDEPAAGLRLRSAPGHRVGHSILEIGRSFVHAADAFHHPLHVEHPEWDTEFDTEPDLGLETRRALLAEFADSGATVVVSHIARPGRVQCVADGFRWQEAE